MKTSQFNGKISLLSRKCSSHIPTGPFLVPRNTTVVSPAPGIPIGQMVVIVTTPVVFPWLSCGIFNVDQFPCKTLVSSASFSALTLLVG